MAKRGGVHPTLVVGHMWLHQQPQVLRRRFAVPVLCLQYRLHRGRYPAQPVPALRLRTLSLLVSDCAPISLQAGSRQRVDLTGVTTVQRAGILFVPRLLQPAAARSQIRDRAQVPCSELLVSTARLRCTLRQASCDCVCKARGTGFHRMHPLTRCCTGTGSASRTFAVICCAIRARSARSSGKLDTATPQVSQPFHFAGQSSL